MANMQDASSICCSPTNAARKGAPETLDDVREQETNFKAKKKSEEFVQPSDWQNDATNPNCPSFCASSRTGGSFESSNPFFLLFPSF